MRKVLRDAAPFVVVAVLFAGVYLLPPDTSLAQVRAAGILRVCVPTSYPPLVTGDLQAPGIDVELLTAIAAQIGVTLSLSANPAIGRDFNPRSWGVTRAQCQLLAGGVVGSATTRSFLETTGPHAETGWAAISAQPLAGIDGRRIGVFVGVSGLDRIALSRYLRDRGVQATIVPSAEDLVAGLRDGRFEAGVTEALLAGGLAGAQGWTARWLPGELERYPVVFGLWKGDLTLKRAIVGGLEELRDDGEVDRIIDKYLAGSALL